MQRFTIILLALIVTSCSQPKIPLLNTNNLPSSFITIDAGKDYQLKTFKGAILKIAANSFDVPAGVPVKIEMKEAYTIADILAGGLSTRSDGRLLQSGGMVYFNATANGKAVDFLKPVSITTPASVYNDSMQLFKGEVGKDSSINWVNPAPLDTSPIAKYMGIGEALFKANCANCHKPLQEATGPSLAGARQRAPDNSWPYKFVNNVNSMLEYDTYAKWLVTKYGARMTQFNLPEQDIKAILDYCDNEAALYKPDLLKGTPFVLTAADSLSERKYITANCYDTLEVPVFDSTIRLYEPDTTASMPALAGVYTMPEVPAYSFSIKSSGWYNIDCFVEAYENLVTDAELQAELSGELTKDATVYLCIPSRKLLTYGKINKEGLYEFYEKKIPLILDDDAFIFAVGGDENNISFGSKSFRVKSSQLVTVELKMSSRDAVLNAFKRNNLDGVKIDLQKNRVEIIMPGGEIPQINNNSTIPDTSDLPDTTKQQVELQIIKRDCFSSPYPPVAADALMN